MRWKWLRERTHRLNKGEDTPRGIERQLVGRTIRAVAFYDGPFDMGLTLGLDDGTVVRMEGIDHYRADGVKDPDSEGDRERAGALEGEDA